MKRNLSNTDRFIRILVSLVLVYLTYAGYVSGFTAKVFIALAIVFTATSIFSFCPIYAMFGLSTCPAEKKAG